MLSTKSKIILVKTYCYRNTKIFDQSGFTLLEAIVALVLVSTVGMSLFAWVNTQLEGLYRLEGHHQRQYAKQNALEFIQVINPLENPRGSETMGIYTVTWQATAIEPPRDGIYPKSAGMGLFQVGLYNTQISVFVGDNDTALTRFQVRLFGYKQVREPEIF